MKSPAMDWWFWKPSWASLLYAFWAVTVLTAAPWEHQILLLRGTSAELLYVLVWFYGYWLFNILEILLLQGEMRSSQA